MRYAEPTNSARTTTRRVNFRTPCAQDYIDARRDFSAGSLRGMTMRPAETYLPSTGELPAEWRKTLRADMASADEMMPAYVVWSYATPIAWQVGSRIVIPAVRYSQTTSRHQSAARMGLDTYDAETGWQHDYIDSL